MLLWTSVVMLMQVTVPAQDTVPPRDSARAAEAAEAAQRAARHARHVIALTPALEATAYEAPLTRQLIARARQARLAQDSSLRSYDATTKQRISAGLGFRVLGRERLAYRSENAARVRWQRGTGAYVDMLGARTALPMVFPGARVLKGFMDQTTIPYFPGRETFIGFRDVVSSSSEDASEEMFVHPLSDGAEAYYRYEQGDSLEYTLPDGRAVHLREVQVRARQPRGDLIVGSLWFDAASGQLVRAAYRPSETVDVKAFVEDQDPTSFTDVPRLVKPLIFPMEMTISGMTVEYGLHEQRWWLPRSQAIEGRMRVGPMRVSFSLDERFQYASVNGVDSLPPIALSAADSSREAEAALRRAGDDRAADDLRAARRARRDSVRQAHRDRPHDADSTQDDDGLNGLRCPRADTLTEQQLRYDGALRVTMRIPCDTALLAHSSELPPSIFDPGDEAFSTADRDALMRSLSLSLQPLWSAGPPVLHYGFDRSMLRYNRIEALSAGAMVERDFGAGYTGALTARLGVGDWQPGAELWLERSDGRRTIGLSVYRRLAVVDDWGAPLSVGASMATLLMGRDEAFYFRSWGTELTGELGATHPVTLRLFAEHEWGASVETQFSVPHLVSDARFVDNIVAQRGNVVGLSARYVRSFGLDPHGWRATTDLRGEGGVWDFTYARAAADVAVTHGLGRWLDGALTFGGGTSAGSVPTQRLWYIGGGQSVRGMLPGELAGDAYWLARAELGSSFVAVRPLVFTDLGWAGTRRDWLHESAALQSVGVGASFLDGLVRVDLAKGLRPSHGLRLYIGVETKL